MTTFDLPTAEHAVGAIGSWVRRFLDLLESAEHDRVAGLFLPDGWWRDILLLTWDLRTFHGRTEIAEGFTAALSHRRILKFQLADVEPRVFERNRRGQSIEGFLEVETEIARGRGYLRLLRDPDSAEWRAWTLLTTMEELKGHEEAVGRRRPKGASAHLDDEERDEGLAQDPLVEPQVVILGAGQAGLSLAARLRHMDVPTLVVERNSRVGDNWRNRYQSLVLHNEVWANHLPYMPFPASFPVYIDKNQLADWLEAYATAMDLSVRTDTSLEDAEYDEVEGRWTVRLAGPEGSTIVRPRHLVLATGVFGVEGRLELTGAEDFRGTLIHASSYGADVVAEGQRALVIGTGSSAHDIAQDLHVRGAEVTMLQRSSTTVVSVEPGAAKAYAIYQEEGIATEDADLISNAFPLPLLADLHVDLTERIAELDADLLDGLREAGFAVDFGEDGSGFLMKYHRRGGGYYINVGCSELIAAGEIAVKHGVEVERLLSSGVQFTDGSEMPVDLVVIAIGFTNMSESVRRILGDEIADRVGPIWGLDDEGEVRNMWRRTSQPGLWITGGSLQQVRPYSRYLALQIKGELEGLVGNPATRAGVEP